MSNSQLSHRRQQIWDASGLRRPPKLLRDAGIDEALLELPEALEGEAVVHDCATIGLTLVSHPLALLRPHLRERKLRTAAEPHAMPKSRLVSKCGIATLRQQPETANGTLFISIEDETGVIHVIVWKALREQYRPEVLRSGLLAVYGMSASEMGLAAVYSGFNTRSCRAAIQSRTSRQLN